MYTEIICVKKCIYQRNGRCTRSTAVDNILQVSADGQCLFYKEKDQHSEKSARKFWSELSNNYF